MQSTNTTGNTTTQGLNLSQKDQQFNSLLLYRDIYELPLMNFILVIEKSDKRYLMKLDSYHNLPELEDYSELSQLWDDIYWQYLKEIGLSDKFKMTLELKAKIVLMEAKAVIEQTNKYYTNIEETKIKLKKYQDVGMNQDFSELISILSTTQGHAINTFTTTVWMFCGMMKMHQKQIEAKKKNDSIKR